jgi:predicted PurR-regulated permease PerM
MLVAMAAVIAFLIKPVLVPFILSFVLYAILDPLRHSLTRVGIPRTPAIILVLLLVIVVGFLTGAFLIPRLVKQFAQLQAQLPHLWSALSNLAASVESLLASYGMTVDTNALTKPFVGQASTLGKSALVTSSNALLAVTSSSLLIPIFTFFLLRDFRSFRNQVLDTLPNSRFELGWLIYGKVAKQLQGYVGGLFLQSTIMAVVTTVGFMIAGIQNPLLLGFMAGVLNLIPYVGPILAMIPPVIIALGVTPIDPVLIGSGIIVIIIGQLVDNLITIPLILAQSVALHPLVVIVGIIIFGNFFGLLGMMVAIPVISTGNILFRELHRGLSYA